MKKYLSKTKSFLKLHYQKLSFGKIYNEIVVFIKKHSRLLISWIYLFLLDTFSQMFYILFTFFFKKLRTFYKSNCFAYVLITKSCNLSSDWTRWPSMSWLPKCIPRSHESLTTITKSWIVFFCRNVWLWLFPFVRI